MKELCCLLDITRALVDENVDSGADLDRALTHVLELLPSGFQYPAQTVAVVEIDGRTRCLVEPPAASKSSMSVPIPDGKDSVGVLSVVLVGATPDCDAEVFLPGERMLLEAVAERISAALRLRAARADLLQREAQFRSLIENSSDVITLLDAAGRITYQSPSLRQMMGYTPEELLGRSAFDIVHDDDVATVREAFQRALERPAETVVVQYRMRSSIGEFEWVESLGHNMIDDPTIGNVIVNTRVVSERLAAQDQIRFQAGLLDAVGQPVIAADVDGTIVYWNRAAERLYGWSRDEVIGRSATILAPPGAKAAASEIIRGVLNGQAWSGEVEMQCKDGTTVPVLESDTPFLDADGRIAGIIGAGHDLTELKRLEAQLLHAQKMEAVGRLAGGVAHDFNNVLTAIVGHADLVLMDLPADSPAAGDVREIVRAVDRAASLTRQLLAFSRRQMLQPRTISLATVTSEMLGMLRRLIGEDIELRTELKSPALVHADPVQMEQVILNLAVNSRDAMPLGGKLTLTVDEVAISPAQAGAYGIASGTYGVLSVVDTGEGMSAEALEYVFEPFYTTKSQGTGLGLATVYGIVKQSDGDVVVASTPGEGTRFDVYLPIVDGTVEPVEQPAAGRIPTGSETVLVVEDEAPVRSLACRVLRRKGYKVLDAAGPAEALERFADYVGVIDVILSDVVMPGMNGPEFVGRFLARRPASRVLYISGYMAEDVQRRGALAADAWFLPKPFTPDQLALQIREVLDADLQPAAGRQEMS